MSHDNLDSIGGFKSHDILQFLDLVRKHGVEECNTLWGVPEQVCMQDIPCARLTSECD